ncbi:MAG: hypothetical protein ACK57W_10110 [Flavobacteriales bacterium]
MKNDSAQLCYRHACLKVEGSAAKKVNEIVVTATLILAVVAIVKALS